MPPEPHPAEGPGGATERLLRLSGLTLRVREANDGPPLLLVHGIGAHVEMWRALERALPDVRAISFDAPGVGRSSTPLLPRTMRQLAGVVERLLDRLGYDTVDVLGYSLGGVLAQELAHRAPDRVRRLALVATTPGWGGIPGELAALLLVSTPLRYYSRTYYERTIGRMVGGRARWDGDYIRRHGDERLLRRPSFRGYAWQLAAGGLWSSLPWLHRLPQPTLVVTGDDDPLMPVTNAMMLASRIPTARVFIAPREGHLLLMDDDSAVFPVLREFLLTERPEAAAAWREAPVVDQSDVDRAMRASGRGPLPWSALSAVYRQAFGTAPPRSTTGSAR